jgi:methionyl-tRNA formyltransferase
LAERLGLPVLTPDNPNAPEFAAGLAGLAPDLAIIVAYGHLIRRPLLDLPRLGFVNLHASLLPSYRGAAPVPWAILRGEAESGVTVFRLDERLDSGGVLARAALPMDPGDTAGSYLEKLAPLGAELLFSTVIGLKAGTVGIEPQNETAASAAPKFKKGDGRIDWSRPWLEIDRKVRAFQPWPLAFTFVPTRKGEARINVLGIARAGAAAGEAGPGRLLSADPGRGLILMAGDGPIRIRLLQPEGRRPMTDGEFLRGTRVIWE